MSTYAKRRRQFFYYQYIHGLLKCFAREAQSALDVGGNLTSPLILMKEIPKRVCLDLRNPYSDNGVVGVKEDFLSFNPDEKFDIVICSQVLEHIDDENVKTFTEKLFAVGKSVLISVPYMWKKKEGSPHLQDPVDRIKLETWTGRKPSYSIIVQELDRQKRLIAYYHNPEEKLPRLGLLLSESSFIVNTYFYEPEQ